MSSADTADKVSDGETPPIGVASVGDETDTRPVEASSASPVDGESVG